MLKSLIRFVLFFSVLTVSQNLWAQPTDNNSESEPVVAEAQTPESSDTTVEKTTAEKIPAVESLKMDEESSIEAPAASTTPSEKETKLIKSIEVKGNKTIGIATILAKIKIRVGEEYLQNVISDDVKRLYNTGYFSDVSVDRQDQEGGFKVIILLTEKPIVEKLTFSKTRQFNPRYLENKMKTKEGKFLDNKMLKDDVATLEDLYAKKGLTSASVDVETTIDETTNKATLHFVIQEGYRVKIKKIVIAGNQAIKYKKIIHTIKTRRAWLLSSGFLQQETLEEDMERIKAFYEKEGYIDATAKYSISELGQGRIAVNIDIKEGKRYFVGALTFNGNKILSEKELSEGMKTIKIGKVFSRAKLDVDLENIRTLYFDKGYIFANVTESTSLNPDDGTVEINLEVTEGELAYVDKIKIQGNTRTRDIVIRRELKMYPGDQFDGTKLRRTKDRLKNLGYFEDVSYDIEDTDKPNQKDLVVQVKEAKTGSFSFGGGYSTVDQVVGFVEVEQKNFDITNWPTFTGGGQNLLLRAETGSFRNNTRLSFTEPWLFDYPISGGFDAYRSARNRETDVGYAYDEDRAGGDIRFGKELTDIISANVMYKQEKIKISNLVEGASADLTSEVGTNVVSTMSFNLARDTRDNIFSPTKGLYLSGSVDVAGGILGGDKDFIRLQNMASYDIPLMFESVLELRGRAGIADAYGDSEKVPIFERFFVGGAKTIRGYNERRIGPIDPVTEDPIGGESMMVGNIEYTVPLIDFIKVAVFFDTGNVWAKMEDFGSGEFKSGAGFGLRVKTPIGPINLDYGYPLNDEPGEEGRTGKFYFSVSRGF